MAQAKNTRYYYHVNIDERDVYAADVRDQDDNTIYTIPNWEEMRDLIDCGFMKHAEDMQGLHEHLYRDLEIIKPTDILVWVG